MSSGILHKVAKKFKNTQLRFSIDKSDEEALAGWVIDSKQTSKLLFVEVRSQDKLLYRTEASMFRQDLLDADVGSGCHGFHIATADLLPSGGSKPFDLYVDGVKLNDESIILSYDAESHQTQPIADIVCQSNFASEKFKVAVDVFAPGEVLGWTLCIDDSSLSPEVELKLNGATLARSKADKYRKDLADANIKGGNAAYHIEYDVNMLPVQNLELELYVDGLKVESSVHDCKLSVSEIEEVKKANDRKHFVVLASKEIDSITQQIRTKNINNGLPAESYSGICNVLIERLAEANVKISQLESLLKK